MSTQQVQRFYAARGNPMPSCDVDDVMEAVSGLVAAHARC